MYKTKYYDNNLLIPEIVKFVNEGRKVEMTIRGRSMRPFLEDGRDRVVLAQPLDIKVGDVVLAKTVEKQYVIHRLTKMDNSTGLCELRGDGNLDMEHCDRSDILAKIVTLIIGRRNKIVETESRRWKFYSFIWVRLLPIRRYLLAFYRRVLLRFVIK